MKVSQLVRILSRFEADGYGQCEVVYPSENGQCSPDMLIAVKDTRKPTLVPVILLCDGEKLEVSPEPPPATDTFDG